MSKYWYRVTYARRGMELLDEKSPEWLEMVAGKRLFMQFGTDCVLGKTFCTFAIGVKMLDISYEQAEQYGFTILDPDSTASYIVGSPTIADMKDPKWNRLARTWEKMIAERVSAWPRKEVK